MKIVTFEIDWKSSTGKDYFDWVIDRTEQHIFVLKNASCTAHAEKFLAECFGIERWDVENRFRIFHSGSELDENKIPKKYLNLKKWEI